MAKTSANFLKYRKIVFHSAEVGLVHDAMTFEAATSGGAAGYSRRLNVEVTPEMITAGVEALMEADVALRPQTLVSRVYLAMARVLRSSSTQAI